MTGRIRWSAAVLCLALAAGARGAAPWTPEIPWSRLDAGPAVEIGAARLDDPATGWSASLVDVLSASAYGERGVWYLRWQHVDLATAGLGVRDRWPETVSPDSDPTWPGESQIVGWSRPLVGLLGLQRLPLLGETGYAVEGAMPFAPDALYPFGARSVSLKLQLRRAWAFGGGLRAEALGGKTWNLGGGGDVLGDGAFGDETTAGLGVAWRGSCDWSLACRGLRVAGGRESRLLRADLAFPATAGVRVAVSWSRDLADAGDRIYRDGFYVTLTLPGLVAKKDEPTGSSETE